jgi:DNA polymerase
MADERRRARQLVETARLLGVPFVPIAAAAREPAQAEPGSQTDDQPALVEPKQDLRFATGAAASLTAEHRPPADKHAALEALYKRYRADDGTAAHIISGWNNIVFHDGDPDASLMFIGEAPGADEDAAGVPFVGRAGQKLNEMINAMGLTREGVYISNVVKVRPPGNRDPTPAERNADGPYLLEQIHIVRPRVIVTLGKAASSFVLDRDATMGSMRGTWFEHDGIPVMPTYHPAYLLRQYTPENRRKVWSDLQKAMERIG